MLVYGFFLTFYHSLVVTTTYLLRVTGVAFFLGLLERFLFLLLLLLKDYAKVDEEAFEVISNTGIELSPITYTYVNHYVLCSYS